MKNKLLISIMHTRVMFAFFGLDANFSTKQIYNMNCLTWRRRVKRFFFWTLPDFIISLKIWIFWTFLKFKPSNSYRCANLTCRTCKIRPEFLYRVFFKATSLFIKKKRRDSRTQRVNFQMKHQQLTIPG